MICRKFNNSFISPLLSISVAYIFLILTVISFYYLNFFNNNNYLKWGPPIKLWQFEIKDNFTFYWVLIIYFLNEVVNSFLSESLYPWIVNCIQDPKSRNTFYSQKISITIIIMYTLYSQLNLIFVINGSLSQISFFVSTALGSILTSTYINWNFIQRIKKENKELRYENI